LHTEDVACTQTASASDITARTCDVCIAAVPGAMRSF